MHNHSTVSPFCKRCLFIFFLFPSLIHTEAQTTLAAGDILFTGYNATPSAGIAPDTFSFVLLNAISSSTVIYFTERGYQGGSTWQASGSSEGTISWTSGTALTIGQEVQIAGLGASAATVNGLTNGTVATVSGGSITTGLSLSNAGDEIIAFQGGSGDPTNGSAIRIAGINWSLNCGTTTDAGWNGAGCTYGPQTSAMPSGLTGGTNAFLAGTAGSSPNNDQAKFNCTGTPFSTVATLRTAIMNKSNWSFGGATGTTVMDIPPGCNYYGTLAIDLLYFKGSVNSKAGIDLLWATEAEVNADKFVIERSENGASFIEIGEVKIHETHNVQKQYLFTDNSPLAERNFYRLKEIQKDGITNIYKTILVMHEHPGSLVVYPNPVSGKNFFVKGKDVHITHATLKSTTGQSLPVTLHKISDILIEIKTDSKLRTGLYILTLHTNSGTVMRKLSVE